jgi:uncharacterized protein
MVKAKDGGQGSHVEYSRYNRIVKTGSAAWALYNFRTGKLAHLNPVTLDTYEHALDRSAHTKFARSLREEGFLVDYDERAHMRAQLVATCGQTSYLGLVVCPTLSCNFTCPYCFEHARRGTMDASMRKRVVEFAEKRAREQASSHFEVIWYGGEPLLCQDVIADLSARFMDMCERLHMTYTADIVTNGYLLDRRAGELLRTARVKNVQITLDGPDAATHDATRHLADGSGSFDRIIDNLRELRADLHIDVRCNCHAQNVDRLGELRELLDRIASENGLSIDLTPAYMDGEMGAIDAKASCSLALGREEYSDAFFEFYRQGMGPTRYRFFGSGCMACNANGYAVDDAGDIYLCWEHMGDADFVIGNIEDCLHDREPDARVGVYDSFMASMWPGDDEECMDCEILPVCLGGCPHKRVVDGRHVCWPLKYNMDAYIRSLCIAEKGTMERPDSRERR